MELNFYSSRKERLSQASNETKRAYEKRNSGNFLKRNPHLRIMIIDLFIVLLFAVIIIPFFLKLTKNIKVDNYKIESKAVVFEENILISIKISRLFKDISTPKITKESIKVEINKNTDHNKYKESIFPQKKGETIYVTFKLEENKEIEFIHVNLLSGKFNKEFKINIKR